jgi:hypothetical protein
MSHEINDELRQSASHCNLASNEKIETTRIHTILLASACQPFGLVQTGVDQAIALVSTNAITHDVAVSYLIVKTGKIRLDNLLRLTASNTLYCYRNIQGIVQWNLTEVYERQPVLGLSTQNIGPPNA